MGEAISYYIDICHRVKEGMAVTINRIEVAVEEKYEESVHMTGEEFNDEYGRNIQYSNITVEDYYIYNGRNYAGDSELLEDYLLNRAKYFNMRMVCKKANVSYNTYRGMKVEYKRISKKKMLALLTAMSEIGRESWNDEIENQFNLLENLAK